MSKEFQEYAWFSVQVDQYYAATRIFARYHASLKAAYKALPTKTEWPKDTSGLSDGAKTFFICATSALNLMGTTGIFSDAPYPQLGDLPTDMVNFGFYTCFCFQWTLFENFTKSRILGLVEDGLLSPDIASKLESLERRTEAFLKYIDAGDVFGHTPFNSVLPVSGWSPQLEPCGYNDLDTIRVQRNKFIHAVADPSILPNTEPEKEHLYERSMWVLRQFAGNIDQDVEAVRTPAPSQPGP